ncbi:MAG: glutamate-5-semialdehyde dehydrogenase [Cyanobacteria bacterium REEB459]|nr:glutamate-5-semialdehyde dehydrogenase [Cyanobacteria bacterium REEB459]
MIASPPSSPSTLAALAQATRQGAQTLSIASTTLKNQALEAIALALEDQQEAILAANQRDCQAAEQSGLARPLCDRLRLNLVKLKGAIAGIRDVARLTDPVGRVQLHRQLDEGLILSRISCPLGVLGVIFESRPDAVMQIASLAIKSGNGVMLKGGSEAVNSCRALVAAIHQGLGRVGLDTAVVQLLTTREETQALLELDRYIDLIIPRGSNSFVQFVQSHTRIPVLGHADGICHLYVDAAADIGKASAIAVDAKAGYPSACNAIETLLIHQAIAPTALPVLVGALRQAGVEIRGDGAARQVIADLAVATETDWATEYNDLILAVKVVDSVAAAIAHINTYGSRHTDAIVTEDAAIAAQFISQVDAAGVYHNCSTRFADGFRYGFGAEVGISTQKMPPRGPVGLDGLVTYKYQLVGNGHIVATYSGDQARPFIHQDLPG